MYRRGQVRRHEELGDLEPYSIIGGNPARLIRKRFDDGLIALLLHFAWWDRSPEEVTSLLPLLTCSDIEAVRRKLVELTS